MKERKVFFSSTDISVEIWDQASGQNHVLQVKNQFFYFLTKGYENCQLEQKRKPVTVVAPLANECKITP